MDLEGGEPRGVIKPGWRGPVQRVSSQQAPAVRVDQQPFGPEAEAAGPGHRPCSEARQD